MNHSREYRAPRVRRTAAGYQALLAAPDAEAVRRFMEAEIRAYESGT